MTVSLQTWFGSTREKEKEVFKSLEDGGRQVQVQTVAITQPPHHSPVQQHKTTKSTYSIKMYAIKETPMIILCDLSDHHLRLQRWIACELASLVRL